MPIPLGGLVPVAEYGSVFEAEVATRRLVDAGVQATMSYDPALNSVASYMASDRTVEVLVHPEDLERARDLLDVDPLEGLPDAFQDPPPRSTAPDPIVRSGQAHAPHRLRWVAVVVLAALILPLVASLISLVSR